MMDRDSLPSTEGFEIAVGAFEGSRRLTRTTGRFLGFPILEESVHLKSIYLSFYPVKVGQSKGEKLSVYHKLQQKIARHGTPKIA